MSVKINQTGVRDGERIVGVGKQCRGSIIQVRGLYPPSIHWIEQLSYTCLRDEYSSYKFFSSMSTDERKKWLDENCTDNEDLYMEDVIGLRVKFIKLCGDFFNSLSEDIINYLLNGNPDSDDGYFNIYDVYSMFPRKPGSKARKHTLIFRPSNWSLLTDNDILNEYSGLFIDIENSLFGEKTLDRVELDSTYLCRVDKMDKIAILTSKKQPILTYERVLNICSSYASTDEINKVHSIINRMPPSFHKSLIQKLIRTRATSVEHEHSIWSASSVLLASICTLITHPGSFVPNIQRFVSGKESVFKRVAVSICEDSFIEDSSTIMVLYTCALLSQQHDDWIPSDRVLDLLVTSSIYALNTDCMYYYRWKEFSDTEMPLSCMYLSYVILSEIKSFQGDIMMVGSIAENNCKKDKTVKCRDSYTMKLVHAIDHHSFTMIAHFMPYTQTSYDGLFKKIWQEVVGVNRRKEEHFEYMKTMEDNDFVKSVRFAQKSVWDIKCGDKKYINESRGEIVYNYSLDRSWLAGLIGNIDVKLRRINVIVSLRTDDILEFNVIKRPSRGEKTVVKLSDNDKIEAVDKVKKILLDKGVRVKSSTIPILNGCKIYFDKRYIVEFPDKKRVDWDDFRDMKYKFSLYDSSIDLSNYKDWISTSINYTSEVSVYLEADIHLNSILERYDIIVLKRLQMYLIGYKSIISLHPIGRDGKGSEYSVSCEDTAVNHILCAICTLYPSVLERVSEGFKVKCGPVMWIIRDRMTCLINKRLYIQNSNDIGWSKNIGDSRELWEHQKDSVSQMIERYKKGNIIWIQMGMGKTLIVLSYIKYLCENNKMPKYCVYTLPTSAIDSVKREIVNYGIECNEIDMRKNKKNNRLRPFCINLIRHDHMRMNGMDDQLRDLSHDMFFICDEFHLCLCNKTIRTSLSLEIAKLSKDFIAMSGTILNSHDSISDLISWLELVVEFEVTPSNYQVAVGSLVSKRVELDISIKNIDIDLTEVTDSSIMNRYKEVVPVKLGGVSDSFDMTEAISLCYKSVIESMVNDIVLYVKDGKIPFVVTKDYSQQEVLCSKLTGKGIKRIHLIKNDRPLTLSYTDKTDIQVVITTSRQSSGYTLTKCFIMLTSVYYSKQATRDQLEGRLIRIGQKHPKVYIVTYHMGILSYIHEKYEHTKSITEALKGFAKEVGVEQMDISQLM